MQIMRLNNSSKGPSLIHEHAPEPQVGPGELLIRIYAAGVTPTELLWYPSSHTRTGEERKGCIPGHEFSGIVAAAGEQVEAFEIGQEVFGMNDWFSDGAMAEYCLTEPSSVSAKPLRLTHAQAASVPIGSLTAWQGLFDRAHLQAGERVLIHGGAGAVGIFAIQLAHWRGAHVITTASARNLDLVKELGADEVIDYRSINFEEAINDLDVVFDTVGGDTLERSWQTLKPVGRMITIAAQSEQSSVERVQQAFFIVAPNGKQLSEIATMLDQGQLRTVIDSVLPLAKANSAYSRETSERRGRGKIVIAIAEGGLNT